MNLIPSLLIGTTKSNKIKGFGVSQVGKGANRANTGGDHGAISRICRAESLAGGHGPVLAALASRIRNVLDRRRVGRVYLASAALVKKFTCKPASFSAEYFKTFSERLRYA